jgi:hypothetical protein
MRGRQFPGSTITKLIIIVALYCLMRRAVLRQVLIRSK